MSTVAAALPKLTPGVTLGGWQLGFPLGKGEFGEVYEGEKKSKSTTQSLGAVALAVERRAYVLQLRGVPHLPALPSQNQYGDDQGYRYLAMQLMSGSLKDKAKEVPKGRFSPAAVAHVGYALLETFRATHLLGYMYFDLKPANVMLGVGKDENNVFLLDWGCCHSYQDLQGNMLTDPVDAGNDMFRGLQSHAQSPPSPRDDLESLAYLMLWMCRGSLPWEKTASASALFRVKRDTPLDDLCAGCPDFVRPFLEAVRSLPFVSSKVINYTYLLSLLAPHRPKTAVGLVWSAPAKASATTTAAAASTTSSKSKKAKSSTTNVASTAAAAAPAKVTVTKKASSKAASASSSGGSSGDVEVDIVDNGGGDVSMESAAAKSKTKKLSSRKRSAVEAIAVVPAAAHASSEDDDENEEPEQKPSKGRTLASKNVATVLSPMKRPARRRRTRSVSPAPSADADVRQEMPAVVDERDVDVDTSTLSEQQQPSVDVVDISTSPVVDVGGSACVPAAVSDDDSEFPGLTHPSTSVIASSPTRPLYVSPLSVGPARTPAPLASSAATATIGDLFKSPYGGVPSSTSRQLPAPSNTPAAVSTPGSVYYDAPENDDAHANAAITPVTAYTAVATLSPSPARSVLSPFTQHGGSPVAEDNMAPVTAASESGPAAVANRSVVSAVAVKGDRRRRCRLARWLLALVLLEFTLLLLAALHHEYSAYIPPEIMQRVGPLLDANRSAWFGVAGLSLGALLALLFIV